MKDQNKPKDKQSFNSQTKAILDVILTKSVESFGHQRLINPLIKHNLSQKQQKALIFSTSLTPRQFITDLWDYFFGNLSTQKPNQQIQTITQEQPAVSQQNLPQKYTNQIIFQAAVLRQNFIWDQLRDNKIKIQPKTKYKHYDKVEIDQTHKNKEHKFLNQSKATSNSQKDFLQFIKNQKIRKEKRKKLFQFEKQKQLERQHKRQQKELKIKQAQEAKRQQQKRLKQQQIARNRYKQKQLVERHQSYYNEFKNKIYHSPQKAENTTLFQRYESQMLKKLKSQKEKLYKSYEKQLIDEHEKTYLDSVKKRTQQRFQKIQQIKQIQHIQNQKSRIKYKSSFKFQRPHQQYQRRINQEYQLAKQKRDRILSYKDKVKSHFVPQVDQNKKNQFFQMMEQLDATRKGQFKKKVLRNGQVVIEKLQIKDSRQVGLNYLQNVKKQVQKMRAIKKQPSDTFIESSNHQDESVNKKNIDYIKQMQESKSKSTFTGFSRAGRTSFSNTKSSHLSLEQKLKRIQNISTKLMQKTKQQEMLLKYGKFKTSQEILNKKQIIDRNYIDLVNMKLQMIQSQQGGSVVY